MIFTKLKRADWVYCCFSAYFLVSAGVSLAKVFPADVVAGGKLGLAVEVPKQESTTLHPKTIKQTSNSARKYAYTWVIGGIDESNSYKGFLYDVLISVNLLKKMGSEADYWLLAQLQHNSSFIGMQESDMRVLAALGVNVLLLEKPSHSSFANLVYEKFRPLQFTQYSRVLFLDADIVPLVNLDYLFHLSDPEHGVPILRPNLIMATRGEPCNTGMFMMHPEIGAWEELQNVIATQHEIGRTIPYPHFDWQSGWGHSFRKKQDKWEAIKRNGTTWRYHAGHSDQGLWYYFAKYFKQDVSIVIGDRLQNIVPGKDGNFVIENHGNILAAHSPKPIASMYSCQYTAKGEVQDTRSGSVHWCNPVYRDFAHFMGAGKPWLKAPCRECQSSNALTQPHKLWYSELTELNKEYGIGLEMDSFHEKDLLPEPKLGYMATYWDHSKKVLSEAKRRR
mmetsp:Transcript_22468/g.48801  ORF Transcript_22468/g.48801 Transcript_22468/m.48801 type:complete len:449 (-) Transcript_22468:312-1658(-)|eukprot:CAMPEP_0178498422 /NCGR_PEP_ID=MMETSP0696-20121128/15246_1 /TAXON_ID=265572 /ORGANISM="Extubocellulus spinifer, Strain CCMP396" /LENGTH=448 /DNA_ID=CAMNT_0020126979 /DNA_START=21 /DNA_END=1367 /DNA_ORIENTATION=-